MKLYELTEAYGALINLDLEEQDINTALESLEGTVAEKAEGIAMVMRTLEAEQDAYTKEIARLNDLKGKAKKKQDSMKDYLSYNLQEMNIDKLDAGLFKFSFRKSTSLEIDDNTLVPAVYKKSITTEKIDKAAIKKAFKTEEVPGCHLETKKNLQMK